MKKKAKKKKAYKKAEHKDTLVAFLLDRSGSMASVLDDTIGGFNTYLDGLIKNDDGSTRFTLTQFDTVGIDVVHNAEPLGSVPKMNKESYEPRGGTPLYDAIGKTIRSIEKAVNGQKVLFVTLTDGQENSSVEWNEKSVKALIKSKEDKDKWTFAYIGVGAEAWDAVQTVAKGTRCFSNVLNIDPKDTMKAYSKLCASSVSYAVGASGQSCVSNFFGDQTEEEDEATITTSK